MNQPHESKSFKLAPNIVWAYFSYVKYMVLTYDYRHLAAHYCDNLPPEPSGLRSPSLKLMLEVLILVPLPSLNRVTEGKAVGA